MPSTRIGVGNKARRNQAVIIGGDAIVLDNLIRWYDAADASTITESGGLVSSWADKSSEDVDATASGSLRPTTGVATANGNNMLSFNGANGLTMLAGTGVLTAGTIFLVASTNDLVNGSVWLARDTSLGSNFVALGLGAAGAALRLNTGGFGSTNSDGATTDLVLLTATWSGTTSNVRINGSDANNTTTPGTPDFAIGVIGDYTGTASDADKNLAEIRMYDTALGTPLLESTEAALLSKWGIA